MIIMLYVCVDDNGEGKSKQHMLSAWLESMHFYMLKYM